jgi:hypothetical protein
MPAEQMCHLATNQRACQQSKCAAWQQISAMPAGGKQRSIIIAQNRALVKQNINFA